MNTIRFNSKQAFIAALEARRPFWHDYDAKRAKAHAEAEKKWLADTKTALREALKYDYAAMKEATNYHGSLYGLGNNPSCPILEEAKIDRILASLKVTQGQAFTLDAGKGSWSDAHYLLTADPAAKTSVC